MNNNIFTVTSSDKALLRAFIERLEESNYNIYSSNGFNLNDFERPCIIIYNNVKKYDILNHSGGYEFYNLPHQWLDAVNRLNSRNKPKYNVNDYVILDNTVMRIQMVVEHDRFKLWDGKKSHYLYGGNDMIEGHATTHEIYEHLMNQTDIKIGDVVIYESDSSINDIGVVENIELYSVIRKKQKLTKVVKDYYKDHSYDFLVVKYADKTKTARTFPIDFLKKHIPYFTIETNRKTYKPQLKDNKYNIGCVENIDDTQLYAAKYIMQFCKKNGIEMCFDAHGRISYIKMGNEETRPYSNITLSNIEQLIDGLK